MSRNVYKGDTQIGHIVFEDRDMLGVVYDGDSRPYELFGYDDVADLEEGMLEVFEERVTKTG